VKKSINLWAFPYPGQWPLKRSLEISGICSFLFWPYSTTSNDCDRRAIAADPSQDQAIQRRIERYQAGKPWRE
jgi:hypothetical protein